jgi:hypothetical protein
MESTPFTEALLPTRHDAIAPDGSQVRLLVRLPSGSMAHFELGPREVSRPTQTEPSARRGTSSRGWAGCGAARTGPNERSTCGRGPR